MPGKMVPDWCSGLRPSEKAFPEQRSITKIPLCIVIFFKKGRVFSSAITSTIWDNTLK
jgi:hypothetical protein